MRKTPIFCRKLSKIAENWDNNIDTWSDGQRSDDQKYDNQKYNDQKYNNQKSNDQKSTDQKSNDQNYYDPKSNGQKSNDPKSTDQKYNDPKSNDQKSDDQKRVGLHSGHFFFKINLAALTLLPCLVSQPTSGPRGLHLRSRSDGVHAWPRGETRLLSSEVATQPGMDWS
jgi:hypothetical protein